MRAYSPWSWFVRGAGGTVKPDQPLSRRVGLVADNAVAIAFYERAGFLRCEGEALGERAPGEICLVRSLMTATA